jgi:hypothetical protein
MPTLWPNIGSHGVNAPDDRVAGKTTGAKQNNPIIAPAWVIPTRHHTQVRFSVHTLLPEQLGVDVAHCLPRYLRVDAAYRCFVARRFPIG